VENETGSAGRPEGSALPGRGKDTAAEQKAGEGSTSEPGAANQQVDSAAPIRDVAELERLGTRLTAKYHGRRM
jgi:hypothetical protein